jgi:uncharacterized protein
MLLDLKNFFSNGSESRSFDYQTDLSAVKLNGVFPFVSPVAVRGKAVDRDGFAKLDLNVSFDFSIPCDRCAAQIERHYDFAFDHMLVRSLENEDDDRFIEVKNDELDLDELVREDILLELPTKFLCRENCKGLCPVCGKNLNEGPCGCDTHPADPRMEVLKKLLH